MYSAGITLKAADLTWNNDATRSYGSRIYIGGGMSVQSALNHNVIRMETANETRLYIAANGTVGIGTTNPTKPLEILGASGGLLKLVNSTSAYQGGQSNIEFWNNNSNYRLGQISAIDTAPSDTYRSALAFSASFHTDGFVEGMRIVAQSASSAFVGIGTTSPMAPLHVLNTLTTTSATQAAFTQTTGFEEGTNLSCNGTITEIKMNKLMTYIGIK